MNVEIDRGSGDNKARRDGRSHVTIIGTPLKASAMAAMAGRIADSGANIDRIERMARYPVTAIDLHVSGADTDPLRTALAAEAAVQGVDIAVQPANLLRRGMRLIVMDVDSTLVQGEVIEMLAEHAGFGNEVAEVTEAAMRGELDFEESLRARVALLAGVDASAFDDVYDAIELAPGARTLVRTLRRLGYRFALVSGGFSQITDRLAADLGIHFSRANELEVVDGRLTGRDRRRRRRPGRQGRGAARVRRRARRRRESAVIAIGDGANDLDMLNAAGLGIAYNAKPVVQDAADTSVNVPYLDAILYLLGISREEIEAADAEAGIVTPRPPSEPVGASAAGPTWKATEPVAERLVEVGPVAVEGKTATALVGKPVAISCRRPRRRRRRRAAARARPSSGCARPRSACCTWPRSCRAPGRARSPARRRTAPPRGAGSRSQPAPSASASQVCWVRTAAETRAWSGTTSRVGQPGARRRGVADRRGRSAAARSRSGRPARPWRGASRRASSSSLTGASTRPTHLGCLSCLAGPS